MSKRATKRQEVLRFAREQGLRVNSRGGVPVISTENAEWMEVYDSWDEAHAALVRYYQAGAYPWKRNPVPPSVRVQLRDAARLYADFSGHDPEIVGRFDKPAYPDVLIAIGEVDGILYTTVRDGQTEKYIHEFAAKSRPLLCSTHDGSQLYMLGGAYDFTERGIVDKTGRKK